MTFKPILLATLLLVSGRSVAFSISSAVAESDTAKTDTIVADTAKASTPKKDAKSECCSDTTVKDHTTPYHKIVKEGGSVREGLFTVRHIKDDWYLEVPDEVLGRMLLCVTRFISVPQGFSMFGGEEVNRSAVYLEQRNDKTLFLREYVQSQFAKPNDRIAISLKQSTVDPIIQKFEVIGRNPKTNAQLINVTKWVLADNKVFGFTSNDRQQLGLGGLMNDRSYIDSIKTYPINIEVQSLRTYGMSKGNTGAAKAGAATLSLNTSIVLLPEEPMQPRYDDERVGYFNNRITEFSDDQQTTKHEALISRYRLEPKDPIAYKAGKLVEPKKQIVYYIDPSTPKKWVKYLKMGIDDWNAAFEAAGFKHAIVGKEWPNDSTMSLDDARFSVLRYLPSETENAYGPHIVDPRSGEIIEAHVCWYHNVMNLLKKWYMVQCGPNDKNAQKMVFSDELMGQLIRFVSSHEVGHTLGLRHNMIASNATPVEKLRDKTWVEKHGHTSSIMDYARFNYVAQPEDHISPKGLFPRINDYDKWAIKFGYQYRPEFKDPASEKKALRAEVTKVLKDNRRLWYRGDEGSSGDPRSQTEDLGDDQMKANEYGIKNLKRVMQHIEQWTAQPDGQTEHLEEIYEAVRSQVSRYTNHVARYLSGSYNLYNYSTEQYERISREKQHEALEWLGRNILEAPMWLYPDRLNKRLGTDYAGQIGNRQSSVLSTMLSTSVIGKMVSTHLQNAQSYDAEEYLNDVFSLVWKPLDSKEELQNAFRRQQQRSYVDIIGKALNPEQQQSSSSNLLAALLSGSTGGSTQSDAVIYLEQHLGKVENYLKAQQGNGLNGLHYKDLLLRIKKIREKYESAK